MVCERTVQEGEEEEIRHLSQTISRSYYSEKEEGEEAEELRACQESSFGVTHSHLPAGEKYRKLGPRSQGAIEASRLVQPAHIFDVLINAQSISPLG